MQNKDLTRNELGNGHNSFTSSVLLGEGFVLSCLFPVLFLFFIITAQLKIHYRRKYCNIMFTCFFSLLILLILHPHYNKQR